MISIFSKLFLSKYNWMIFCTIAIITASGCDKKSSKAKAADTKTDLSTQQFKSDDAALQLAIECQNNEAPAYNRAESCISYAKLTNATQLSLINFGLERIPPSLFKLANLTVLNLSKNQLASLPESIGKLKKLTTLHLFDNKLSSLPDTTHSLIRLRWLNLKNNHIEMIPQVIFKLPDLNRLNLQQNSLTTLPNHFNQIPHLELLNLRDNKISSIPESLMTLKELRRLYLDNNRIKTFDLLSNSLPALEQLSLANNSLERIDPEIASLDNLWFLNIEKSFYKTLPKEVSNSAPIIFAGKYNIFSGRNDSFQSGAFKDLYELSLPYANSGDFRAQHFLGDLLTYDSEENNFFDYEQGINWYRKAVAISGNSNMQFDLAMTLRKARLHFTITSKQNIEKEVYKWMVASAEQGHAYAQMQLAICYHFGRGVERDYVQAYKWYKLASNRFNANSIMVKGKDVSDKGLASSFMAKLSKTDEFTERQKKLALTKAKAWEDEHPRAYKFWPYWSY